MNKIKLLEHKERERKNNMNSTNGFNKHFDIKNPNNILVSTFMAGTKEDVLKLIESGENINIRNELGHTALHVATMKSDLVKVKELIECGADVNTQDVNGQTPLMRAVRDWNVEIVEEILKCKPDLEIKDVNGRNVAHIIHEICDSYFGESKENINKINKIYKLITGK